MKIYFKCSIVFYIIIYIIIALMVATDIFSAFVDEVFLYWGLYMLFLTICALNTYMILSGIKKEYGSCDNYTDFIKTTYGKKHIPYYRNIMRSSFVTWLIASKIRFENKNLIMLKILLRINFVTAYILVLGYLPFFFLKLSRGCIR